MRKIVAFFGTLLILSFIFVGYNLTQEKNVLGELPQFFQEQYSRFSNTKNTSDVNKTQTAYPKESQIQPEPVDSSSTASNNAIPDGSIYMPYFLERSYKKLSGIEGKLEKEPELAIEPQIQPIGRLPYFLERSYKRLALKEKADILMPLGSPIIPEDNALFDDIIPDPTLIQFQSLIPEDLGNGNTNFLSNGVQIDIEIPRTQKNANFLKRAVTNILKMNDNVIHDLREENDVAILDDNAFLAQSDAVLAATMDLLDQMLLPLVEQTHSKKHKKNRRKEKKEMKRRSKKNKKHNKKKNDDSGDEYLSESSDYSVSSTYHSENSRSYSSSSSELVSHPNELSVEVSDSYEVLSIANTIPNDGMSMFNEIDPVQIDPAEIQAMLQE